MIYSIEFPLLERSEIPYSCPYLLDGFRDMPLIRVVGIRTVKACSIETGQIKALWLVATNPMTSMPNTNRIRKTLEKQLSARLFKQTSSGYVLTASESIEGLVLGSHRRIEGADAELSGEVYISISDIFDESCICSKPG